VIVGCLSSLLRPSTVDDQPGLNQGYDLRRVKDDLGPSFLLQTRRDRDHQQLHIPRGANLRTSLQFATDPPASDQQGLRILGPSR
jgi:hypothetical protein